MKRQKLQDLTHIWNLKKSNTQKQCLPGAERWGKWRDAGQSVQSCSFVG